MSTPEHGAARSQSCTKQAPKLQGGFIKLLEQERKVSSLTQVVQWMLARLGTLRDGIERGAAAVEYGLLVALIAVAIIGAVIALGGKVKGTFTCVANSLPQTSTSTATSAAC
jgi:pilus assembly protein Flp/PilA